MNRRSIKKDIAIIGMSGKFPKSENLLAFWKNLVEGNELIHFYSDLELEELGVSSNLIKNDKYVKSGAFLEDSGSFDYSFFGYTQEEAELMDPQIRILHEQVWLSLEDAGYNPFNYSNKIGCFFTAADNLAWRAHAKLLENSRKVNPFLLAQISNRNMMSMLISYSLNLKGPSYFVDTACSSSLVAVHIACRNLLMKECSIALAGGVCISSMTDVGYIYDEGMIYSKDGHCKAFDIDSSGTVGGEGVGIVVLKRLEDALNDRDHIYSVIRSSSVNNDGSRKIGYTAPSVNGQYECIKSAHLIADVDPQCISYIETHGTGTKLGDPVELEALNKAFNYDTTHQCAIGSLKTNIGHLDAAAGIAGLIKTVLSLDNKFIPPSLHFKAPNPEVNFKSGPFYVNSKLKKWESETIRLAGVSSLGIGGTNAHVILEEAPIQEKGSFPKAYKAILYSAKTQSSLERYQNKLKDFFDKNKNLDLADLSYTFKTGRNNHKYRKFFICKDNADAAYQLDLICSLKPFNSKEKKGVVFMFSGQGSQYYKMGKQIYMQFPYFRSIIDDGLAILKNETGINYATIIGYDDTLEPETDLINDTCFTQPLLFLIEYAFAKLLMTCGVKPANMIGHSLGEYVAACIAEVFSFEEGLKLIVKRAYFMNALEQGLMLSVDLPVDKITEYITSDVSIAAVNTVNSCVISGNINSINAISDVLVSKEISFVKLKTSHAFHSQMMDSILNDYEMELNKIKFLEPKHLFISANTGLAIKKEEAVSAKYWVNHLRDTVHFSKGLDFLLKEGYSTYIEIGPGKTLINFLRQNENYSDGISTTVLKHSKETKDDSYYLLNTLGTIWSAGVDIDWKEYYVGEVRNKVSAPTYSFDKIIFPVKVNLTQKFAELSMSDLVNSHTDDYSEWIYEQGWKELKNEISQNVKFDGTICFLGNDEFSEKLKKELIRKNGNVIFIKKNTQYLSDGKTITIDPSRLEDYEKLSVEISKKINGTIRIVHAWCAADKDFAFDSSPEIEDMSYFSLLNIARTFLKKKNYISVHLYFLVNDLFKVNGTEKISSSKSIALAALRIIPKESENVYCKCIEFLIEDFEKNILYRDNLFSRLDTNSDETEVALRGNKIWKPFYQKIKVNKESLVENMIKPNGLYVVTGSDGGIAKVIADFLTNEYNADLILIGRSLANESSIEKLRKGNNNVHYIHDDLFDKKELKNKIDLLQNKIHKKVDGIFHTAGLGDYSGLIVDRIKKDCQDILLPKVKGTSNLFDVFKNDSPDFIVLCSSLSAVLSPFGQVAYVAANLYQNFFAQEHDSKTKIVSIQWDAWKETGMAVKSNSRYSNKTNNDILSFGISNKEGVELFKYALNSKSCEIIISINPFDSQLKASNEFTLKKAIESVDEIILPVLSDVERPDIHTIYKEAKSDNEKKLAELWKSIFGYEKIGINDDFFELGGDSLKAMTLIKKIHKSFNIEIGIGDFFKRSNIEELAKEIDLALEFKEINESAGKIKKSNQIRL